MGEPIAVVARKSGRSGYCVFETNRSFTGMGHEQYSKDVEILGDRSVDQLAGMLLEKANVDEVHVYAQSITLKTADGFSQDHAKTLIEDFYIYYAPGVEVPDESSFS